MTDGRSDDSPMGDAGWTVVEQRAYDRSGPDDLTTVIIEAIADAEGVDMTAIKSPPLYEVVDTSAIEDGFFGPRIAGKRRDTVGSVNFEYSGFRVTVRSDGWVQVAEPSGRKS